MSGYSILDKLHEALGEQLLERIKSGEATPADFKEARGFLKDNDFQQPSPNSGSALHNLATKLPFEEPEASH